MSNLDAYVAPVGADAPAEDELAATAGSSPTRAVARSAAVGEYSNCISTTDYFVLRSRKLCYDKGAYLEGTHEIFISSHELSLCTNTKSY